MDSISIKETDYTPNVEFDVNQKQLSISGFSMPENTKAFYDPIIAALAEYFSTGEKSLDVLLKFEYFNTSSSKAIYDILALLEDNDSNNVKIKWSCEDDDDEMINAGNQFKSMFEISNFDMVIK